MEKGFLKKASDGIGSKDAWKVFVQTHIHIFFR